MNYMTMIKSNLSKAGLSQISLMQAVTQNSAENTQATLSNLLKCSQGFDSILYFCENYQENNRNFKINFEL